MLNQTTQSIMRIAMHLKAQYQYLTDEKAIEMATRIFNQMDAMIKAAR